MIDNFLKIAGVNTEAEFYSKYPSKESFFKDHPEAMELSKFATGTPKSEFGGLFKFVDKQGNPMMLTAAEGLQIPGYTPQEGDNIYTTTSQHTLGDLKNNNWNKGLAIANSLGSYNSAMDKLPNQGLFGKIKAASGIASGLSGSILGYEKMFNPNKTTTNTIANADTNEFGKAEDIVAARAKKAHEQKVNDTIGIHPPMIAQTDEEKAKFQFPNFAPGTPEWNSSFGAGASSATPLATTPPQTLGTPPQTTSPAISPATSFSSSSTGIDAAYNQNMIDQQLGLITQKYGGDMIKRADGHYSKRGLWDNIRANRGSGKEPTKEMLEQERKIRADEYKTGGSITFTSGGEKHRVYEKESPTGNGEGVQGHIMVTHPTMDKGQWDTIDLTEKAGANTVAQGVAATKQWHEENPEYKNGGYVVKRSHDRKGKTHVVIGPDGTKKYFGDSKLGQHPNDPDRKKAFYARHKHNLENNPYFRAFARATWADGGELNPFENNPLQKFVEGGTPSDYDMWGYATHHPLGALKHMINPEKFHATDEYKRPNHMTFSDESKYSDVDHPGGHWSQTPDGKWTFTPTQWNIDNAGGTEQYQQWWNQTEGNDGNMLILPQHKMGGLPRYANGGFAQWFAANAQRPDVMSIINDKAALQRMYLSENPLAETNQGAAGPTNNGMFSNPAAVSAISTPSQSNGKGMTPSGGSGMAAVYNENNKTDWTNPQVASTTVGSGLTAPENNGLQFKQFANTSTKRGDNAGTIAANNALAGLGMANAALGTMDKQAEYNKRLREIGNTNYNTQPSNPTNPFGNYTLNAGPASNFNLVTNTPAQDIGTSGIAARYGGTKIYKEGGTYLLSPEEVRDILANGGEIDFV